MMTTVERETLLQERQEQLRQLLGVRLVTAAAAVQRIEPGQRVYVGTGGATPSTLLAALELAPHRPDDVTLVQFACGGAYLHDGLEDSPGGSRTVLNTRFRQRAFFIGPDLLGAVEQGQADYVPMSLADVVPLVANGRFAPDVALVQVSMPDRWGYVSLGVSVDITAAMLKHARIAIAEINPRMPFTMGSTTVPLQMFACCVLVDEPILEYTSPPADDVGQQIARYIASIIDDGATLQVGAGRIPSEAMKYLLNLRDLGIHSDIITDSILPLLEAGVITGRRKTAQYRGRVVASYALGTRALYDAIDGNPGFVFLPIDEVADPVVVAAQPRMVSITQAFSVDLTGQVCSDQLNGQFYCGVSSQPDFLRGAARSPGGRPIICLRSTSEDGKASRIRPFFQAGEGICVARADVHYVITEFGIAYLYGKSIRERTLALTEIAHPDFRSWLLDEAIRLGYLPAGQKIRSVAAYPVAEERTLTLGNGRAVLIRPSRASDVPMMCSLFHRMTEDDVYTRFFRRLKALPDEEAQRLCNVDYRRDMAFVAVTGEREDEQIAGSSCYFLSPSTQLAEAAYLIAPEWQGSGLGKALQQRMKEYAMNHKIRGFTAEILVGNSKMVSLARAASTRVSIDREDDTYHVTMLFD